VSVDPVPQRRSPLCGFSYHALGPADRRQVTSETSPPVVGQHPDDHRGGRAAIRRRAQTPLVNLAMRARLALSGSRQMVGAEEQAT
jgi:hypothetical protein